MFREKGPIAILATSVALIALVITSSMIMSRHQKEWEESVDSCITECGTLSKYFIKECRFDCIYAAGKSPYYNVRNSHQFIKLETLLTETQSIEDSEILGCHGDTCTR